MKRVWNYVVTMWQPASAFVLLSLVLAVLFSYRLGTLVPGVAPIERNALSSSQSLQTIIENPIHAPYEFVQFIGLQIHESIVVQRLISGILAGLTVILFYYIVRRFCNTFTAVSSTVLLATSSSLLHNGRLASSHVSVLLLFVLCVSGFRIFYSKQRFFNWILGVVALALALYSPGLIYFIILGSIWHFSNIKNGIKKLSSIQILVLCLLFFILLLTLQIGIYNSPWLWREYLGLPTNLPSITDIIKNILSIPAGIFVFAPNNPLYRLGKQPLLDAFTSVIFIIGLYNLVRNFRLDRFKLLAGIFAVGTLFTAVTGNYENSFVLLPFIFIVIAYGISYLLNEWDKTFPNNPLARLLAILIMSLAVLVSCNYQTRRYFIAWPNNVNTRATFIVK